MKMLLVSAVLASAAGFNLIGSRLTSTAAATARGTVSMKSADGLARRSFITTAFAASAWTSLAPMASAASNGKVVIFGGSGYVGAYAAQMLVTQGYEVVSVSRKSAAEQADKVKEILGVGLSGGQWKRHQTQVASNSTASNSTNLASVMLRS